MIPAMTAGHLLRAESTGRHCNILEGQGNGSRNQWVKVRRILRCRILEETYET